MAQGELEEERRTVGNRWMEAVVMLKIQVAEMKLEEDLKLAAMLAGWEVAQN